VLKAFRDDGIEIKIIDVTQEEADHIAEDLGTIPNELKDYIMLTISE